MSPWARGTAARPRAGKALEFAILPKQHAGHRDREQQQGATPTSRRCEFDPSPIPALLRKPHALLGRSQTEVHGGRLPYVTIWVGCTGHLWQANRPRGGGHGRLSTDEGASNRGGGSRQDGPRLSAGNSLTSANFRRGCGRAPDSSRALDESCFYCADVDGCCCSLLPVGIRRAGGI